MTNKIMDSINEKFAHSWQFQALFHKDQIARVKRNLGKECSYLSHGKEGEKRFIKAVIINSTGGKDTVEIEINPNLAHYREKEYDALTKTLGTRIYERSGKRV